jgi:muramoyltetrapeptide carboxypeptidase
VSARPNRRQFVGALAAAGAAGTARAASTDRPPLLRPRRLRPGDTVGLVSPAGATYERQPFEIAIESLRALGFKVREGEHLRARHGHFAGTDAQRAQDLNAMFADPGVHGIFAMAGGSGCNRIVDRLDYALIRRHPKFFGGFSDITTLLNAIHARTGLVTFHSPVASSDWNPFSVDSFRRMVIDAEAATLRNPPPATDSLAQREERIRTLRGGSASGALLGGNLAVLASLAGSAFLPRFDGAILFLEEINEYIYRVDRMLSTLRLAGVLDRVAGVVLGAFTNCGPGDGFGTLTLDEVFDDYFLPLRVPVFAGAQFGHIRRKHTLPVGLPVRIDADAGTIELLQPAVT